jgi:predicted DNA-binding protein
MAADDDARGRSRVTRGERARRSVRVSDERWQALKEKAARRGETASKVIQRKIEEYLDEED